jgi:hypothetical protein
MNDLNKKWIAVHDVIREELRFRVEVPSTITDQDLDFWAENLTDVVIANFDPISRRR